MANEWSVQLASERFSVTVRPTPPGGAVIYEVERVSPTRERVGEIHEGSDGICRPAAFQSESARKTLDELVPLIHRKFHTVTRRLKPDR
jgi:hypothetical protein